MSLSDLASLGSFVSGLAVLVSLIFLYSQLRRVTEQIKQAEKHQRASISTARNSRIFDMLLRQTEPSFAEANGLGVAGDKSMTDTQIRQFFNGCAARFFNAQDSFYQHRQGLLEDYEFTNMTKGIQQSMMTSPGVRAAYKTARPNFGDEFVRYMDAIVAQRPNVPPPNFVESLRSDIAAELALASSGVVKAAAT